MVHEKAARGISRADHDAVIFDLDGVVTDTAVIHAEAWKRMFDDFLSRYAAGRNIPFRPFHIDTDYRRYVDGKPRFDGVKSFLRSRGIELPDGRPDDPPGAETVHGLGNRKNDCFLSILRERGVAAYDSTVKLLHGLKKQGFRTAIISSSRNCAMILDAANLSELFEVRVDGVDSEILGIAGKPAPDIFLEAARQLKVEPGRAIVIEDAISGVQAGRSGGFGLVVGVARTGDRESLLANGADMAVEDLSELGIAGDLEGIHALPSALDSMREIAERARGKRIAVFLDYDGTLAPIVERPDKAVMPEAMRRAVIALSRRCTVGIISGRDLKDVQRMVNIDASVVYAGSHGFDISGPGGSDTGSQAGIEFLPALDKAEKELSEKLRSVEGALVERKRFAIAVHYRLVNPEKVRFVEECVDRVASRLPELRKAYGKKIFELQPNIDWHKGKALLALLEKLSLHADDVLPFFIGDDVTDEDAFRALQGRGIGIVVRDRPCETAASYSLGNPDEVREFLLKLIPLCGGSGHE